MKTGLYELKKRLYLDKDGFFLIKKRTWTTYFRWYSAIMALNGRVILRKRGLKIKDKQ